MYVAWLYRLYIVPHVLNIGGYWYPNTLGQSLWTLKLSWIKKNVWNTVNVLWCGQWCVYMAQNSSLFMKKFVFVNCVKIFVGQHGFFPLSIRHCPDDQLQAADQWSVTTLLCKSIKHNVMLVTLDIFLDMYFCIS